MHRDSAKKLVLRKDTLRILRASELKDVVGGGQPVSKTCCACTHHCAVAN